MAQNQIGLEIGFDAVRAVELGGGRSPNPVVLRYGEIAIPAGAFDRERIVEPEVIARAIKRLWRAERFTSRRVVLGTGNYRVTARDLTVPKMSLRRIRESLPFIAQELLPFPVEDAVLDFYPSALVPASGDREPEVSGLLVAILKEVIAGDMEVARLANLDPVGLDLIPFAISRALNVGQHSDEVVAVIDVGATTTGIVISRGAVPLFLRLLRAGGLDVTEALTSRLPLSVAQAETVKRRITITGTMPPDLELAAGVASDTVGELLRSLRNTISFFNGSHADLPISRIYLTGGGSRLGGFAKELATLTGLPVSPPRLSSSISYGAGFAVSEFAASEGAFIPALGLAIRGVS
ncbi:MAG: type IV pilus assembly protein PilM [Burkholderiaceae bacterium]|nr:type IV pilus assembly protein PilM [Microbacteriaceae bacterium]